MGKSLFYKWLLFVLLVSLVAYFILIERSYLTALTFVLAGGVYYLYEKNDEKNTDTEIDFVISELGFNIGNNYFIGLENIFKIDVAPVLDNVVIMTIKQNKGSDLNIYFTNDNAQEVIDILGQVEGLNVNILKSEDFIHKVIHILRL